jgi:hypothetical protein
VSSRFESCSAQCVAIVWLGGSDMPVMQLEMPATSGPIKCDIASVGKREPLIDILLREVNEVGGAGLLRHGDPLRHGFDRDDPLGAQHLGGLDREQTDRTRAPDRHDFSTLDASLLGGLIACGENVGQEEHFLVRHSVRHFHARDIGHRHADIFFTGDCLAQRHRATPRLYRLRPSASPDRSFGECPEMGFAYRLIWASYPAKR